MDYLFKNLGNLANFREISILLSNILISITLAIVSYLLLWMIARSVIISVTSGAIKRSRKKLSQNVTTSALVNKTGKIPTVKNVLNDLDDETELKKRQATLFRIVRTALKVLIILFLVFRVLILCGADITPIFAGAGIISVALGFGAQNIVKDCCAGFFILLENQMRVGDFVEIDAAGMQRAKGTVENLSLRQIALRDREGDVHFIANGTIIQVINRTLGFSKALFSFTFYYTVDMDKIIKIINDIGVKMLEDKMWKKLIHEPMHFKELGEIVNDRVEVFVVGSTKPGEQWLILDAFKRSLLKELKKQDVKLPKGCLLDNK